MTSLFVVLFVLFVILVYLFFDYRGPRLIALRPGGDYPNRYLRAKELIVQEYDSEGHLWASRGLLLYRKRNGEDKFTRIAHVPTGRSYLWLNNFSLFRKFTNKPECLEFAITSHGSICVLSAGYMWHSPMERIAFQRTIKLRFYGFGVGRGILSNGLLTAEGNRFTGVNTGETRKEKWCISTGVLMGVRAGRWYIPTNPELFAIFMAYSRIPLQASCGSVRGTLTARQK